MTKKNSRRAFLRNSLYGMASLASTNINPLAVSSASASQDLNVVVLLQLMGGIDPLLILPYTSEYSGLDDIRGAAARVDPGTSPELISGMAYHPSLAPLYQYRSTTRITLHTSVAMQTGATLSHGQASLRMAIGGSLQHYGRRGWTARLYEQGVNLIGLSSASVALSCPTCKIPPVRTATYEDFNIGAADLHANFGGTQHVSLINDIVRELTELKPNRNIPTIEEEYRASQRSMYKALDMFSETLGFQSPLYDSYASDVLLAKQFRNIAQSVNEFKQKGITGNHIFVVGMGGYDMHNRWLSRGNTLMGRVGPAVKVFLDDLNAMSMYDNVVLMTTSEFGRSITAGIDRKDGSFTGGSEHGVGFPSLIFGGKVRGGVYGDRLTLAQLKERVSARRNYWPREVAQERLIIEILENHMGIDSRKVFSDYDKIPDPGDIRLFA